VSSSNGGPVTTVAGWTVRGAARFCRGRHSCLNSGPSSFCSCVCAPAAKSRTFGRAWPSQATSSGGRSGPSTNEPTTASTCRCSILIPRSHSPLIARRIGVTHGVTHPAWAGPHPARCRQSTNVLVAAGSASVRSGKISPGVVPGRVVLGRVWLYRCASVRGCVEHSGNRPALAASVPLMGSVGSNAVG
jgi:hypothetical protein